MTTGHKSRCLPSYQLLTIEQIQTIHTATLELLETEGRPPDAGGCRLPAPGGSPGSNPQ